MGNLASALQQLRAERKQAQLQLEVMDQAISVIEPLNDSGTLRKENEPTRTISKSSLLTMARTQNARWAKAREASHPMALAKTAGSAPAKRTMSASARRRIAAAQRARWAKWKAGQRKAA